VETTLDLKPLSICVAFLAFLASGCVSSRIAFEREAAGAPDSKVAFRSREVATLPPKGLVEFCERQPAYCESEARGDVAGTSEQSLSLLNNLPTGSAGGSSKGLEATNLFQVLLRSGFTSTQTPRTPRYEAELSLAFWETLANTNRETNWLIRPSEDRATYGVDEYWAMPLTATGDGSNARGDCEDYALEKRARLIAENVDPRILSLAVVYSEFSGLHTVLVVRTKQGDIILDNLHDELLPARKSPYKILTMQAGARLTSWSLVQQQPLSVVHQQINVVSVSALVEPGARLQEMLAQEMLVEALPSPAITAPTYADEGDMSALFFDAASEPMLIEGLSELISHANAESEMCDLPICVRLAEECQDDFQAAIMTEPKGVLIEIPTRILAFEELAQENHVDVGSAIS
jgi:predicted transglutaminase-like cysteine proteinase